MAQTMRAHIIEICILQLLLIYTCRMNAAAMTYDNCKSAPSSYQVGGWCFSAYADKSWHASNFSQNASQFVCGPNGNLAVGVTYKALNAFKSLLNATFFYGWLALQKNSTYTVKDQGWFWNTRLPNGQYARFPAVSNNIAWTYHDPDNYFGTEYEGVIDKNDGVCDTTEPLSRYILNVQVAAICQFAALQWTYPKRGRGRFASSTYRIAQMTITRGNCIIECHRNPGCVSLAFNPTISDCQIYSVSPEDPRFSANVTIDATYDWHIRDGMIY